MSGKVINHSGNTSFLQGFSAACFQFGASLIFNVWPGTPALTGEQRGSSRAPVVQAAAPGTKGSWR